MGKGSVSDRVMLGIASGTLSCLSSLRQALKERLTSNPFLDTQVQSHAHWLDNLPQSGFTKSPFIVLYRFFYSYISKYIHCEVIRL